MLCLVRYLFVISTSVIDCLGRFVPKMTCYVSSGTLTLTKLKLLPCAAHCVILDWVAGAYCQNLDSVGYISVADSMALT